ncbi:low temperature requirement protein A [Micromonospora musae]|uniref:low temperature requirement protein A n=1 Tax=Micromonospora musae TaxID=1894970 RepID=UPI001315A576|nr:low temperature requirement protein A [Micromonospora musae]
MTRSDTVPRGPVRPDLIREHRGVEPTTSTELFFDLVYIFTVTQLAQFLILHPDPLGALRTVILLGLIWLIWIYTAWTTNSLRPDRSPVRAMLLAVMLGSLLLSAAIPAAFAGSGLLFAAAYAAVQVGRTGFALWAAHGHPGLEPGLRRSLPWRTGTSLLVVAGGLVGSPNREIIWTAVIVIDVLVLATGFPLPRRSRTRPEQWDVEGGHLAERCQAFILIALGESILVTGGILAGNTGRAAIGAFLLAFAGSVALWWVYFDRTAQAVTAVLTHAGERAGRLSRVAFNYLHPVMVAGIIVSAVGDERLLRDPGGLLDAGTALVVFGGPALFLAGHAAYQLVLLRRGWAGRLGAVLVLLAAAPVTVALRLPVAVGEVVALLSTVAVIIADRGADRRAGQGRGPRSPLR